MNWKQVAKKLEYSFPFYQKLKANSCNQMKHTISLKNQVDDAEFEEPPNKRQRVNYITSTVNDLFGVIVDNRQVCHDALDNIVDNTQYLSILSALLSVPWLKIYGIDVAFDILKIIAFQATGRIVACHSYTGFVKHKFQLVDKCIGDEMLIMHDLNSYYPSNNIPIQCGSCRNYYCNPCSKDINNIIAIKQCNICCRKNICHNCCFKCNGLSVGSTSANCASNNFCKQCDDRNWYVQCTCGELYCLWCRDNSIKYCENCKTSYCINSQGCQPDWYCNVNNCNGQVCGYCQSYNCAKCGQKINYCHNHLIYRTRNHRCGHYYCLSCQSQKENQQESQDDQTSICAVCGDESQSIQ